MILKCDSELKCRITFKNYIENQQKIICFHPFKKDTKQIMPGFGAIYKTGENNIKVEYLDKLPGPIDTEEKFIMNKYEMKTNQIFFIYTKTAPCPVYSSNYIELVNRDNSLKFNIFFSFYGKYYYSSNYLKTTANIQELFRRKKKKIQKSFLRKGCNNLIVEKLRRENQPKKGQYHENENEYEENIENCIRNVYSSFIQNQLKFNRISISKLYLPKC